MVWCIQPGTCKRTAPSTRPTDNAKNAHKIASNIRYRLDYSQYWWCMAWAKTGTTTRRIVVIWGEKLVEKILLRRSAATRRLAAAFFPLAKEIDEAVIFFPLVALSSSQMPAISIEFQAIFIRFPPNDSNSFECKNLFAINVHGSSLIFGYYHFFDYY